MSQDQKTGLMDFADEEEDDDQKQTGGGEEDLLLAPQASANPKKSLMDFADEEEEDDQANLLLQEQEGSKAAKKKKKVKMVASDASEDDDELEDEEEEEQQVSSRKESSRQRKERREEAESPAKDDMEEDVEYASDGDSAPGADDTLTAVTLPSMEAYRPHTTSQCYYATLPRFLFIAGGAYDEDTYNFQKEKDEIRARNGDQLVGDEIIRWRVKMDATGNPMINSDGQPELESNARIVEYTDGTFQLLVGNEAIDMKLSRTQNEFLYTRTTETSEENNERLAFQALCSVAGEGSFRPAGPQSKQQKALEAIVKKQQLRAVKMVDANFEEDPEKEQDERIKRVDELHRANLRRRNRTENSMAARKRRMGEEWTTEFMEKPVANSKKKKTAKAQGSRGRRRNEDDEEEEEFEEEEDEEEMKDFIVSSSEDEEGDDDDDDEA